MSFVELYENVSKSVFKEQAQSQIEQGSDALTCADLYAEQGKPDFVLAFLLLSETTDEVRRAIFARAYERRAELSESKAADFDARFRRPFPIIKLGAQKDRIAAQRIREEKRLDAIER
jgi:hypothetical protein